jgi:molybdate transport system substrate-binding protein
MRKIGLLALTFVGALATVSPVAASAPAKSAVRGDVTVFAASSLTEAFTRIGKDFEHKYRGTHVTLSFNSSATLATQIQEGAPADVFASADALNMRKLVDGGQVAKGGSVVFARNRLEIAVARGNPKRIKTLADTVEPGVTLVLCAPEVPCGKYALQAYAKAHVTLPQVPAGANVKDTLAKVALGEADAAVVYVTDVKSAKGDVQGVGIPNTDNVIAIYPIAPLAHAPNPVAAKAFAQFVSSTAAQKTLRRFGFLAP